MDLQELGDLPGAAKLLIAPGYCIKPYDYEKGRSVCPVGHFNHQCRLLDEAATLVRARERWPAPCRRCGVAPLAEKAAQLRADFYIMTSAMDIARDVYIPATRQKSVQYGLFFLCPYSLEPFMFGLATAGKKGALIPFCRGACSNHDEWTCADVGMKNDQTFVADDLWRDVLRLLEDQRRVRRSDKEIHYHFNSHVYRARS